MLAPSGMELVICLIPAVIVIVIAIIVIDAVRRKPTKTTETNLQADSHTSSTGDVSNVSTSAETAVNSQNGLATTSLVIGILAIIILCLFGLATSVGLYLSNCMGPLAMIMGAIALLQIRKQGGKGKGVAIAGIVIGTLPFIITMVGIVVIAALRVSGPTIPTNVP